MANPCVKKWLERTKKLSDSTFLARITLQDVGYLRNEYLLKAQPINPQTIQEKTILRVIADDLFSGVCPLLFPFLYLDWVCENTLYTLTPPPEISLKEASPKLTEELWAETLYQLAKAVYYLEEKGINHNNLNMETVQFQYFDTDGIALMLTDFEHASQAQFVLGKDLNYFLYILCNGYLPVQLVKVLYPLIQYKNIPKYANEDPFMHRLRTAAAITSHNWNTSGKAISRLIAKMYPFVTDRCGPQHLNKVYGAGIGAIVGDALGMPIEFDHTNKKIVKTMHRSADFNGLSAWANLPAGTFTDDTQMALALIDAILYSGRVLIPTAVAREFKRWALSEPIDVGVHTKKLLKMVNPDGSNWREASEKAHEEKPESAANGAVMRVWPIPILYHSKPINNVIAATVKQSLVTHMHNDSVYAAVFVSCLIHKLLNELELETAIEECLAIVKPHVSKELYDTLKSAHQKEYKDLRGGSGWVVDTMSVVMWSIRNTNTFPNALIRAANVKGDTDTNASITGAIAGALYGFDRIPKEWLKAVDTSDKNVWAKQKMTVETLKDLIATLALC